MSAQHGGVSLLPRLGRASRVPSLVAGMAGVAAIVYFTKLAGLPAPESDLRIPWPALAAAFFLAEIFVVHLEFRRDAHSFSLSEVFLLLGLFFAPPTELLLAQLVGAGAALALVSRQSFLKVAFNCANFALGTSVAILVFRTLADLLESGDVVMGAAASVAAIVCSALGILFIFLAMSAAEGRMTPEILPRMLSYGLTVTLANVLLGLIAVQIIPVRPVAAFLLIVLAGLLFLGYRGFASMRAKYDGLHFIYESSRIVHEADDFQTALVRLLVQVREMLRAEVAEITLFPNSGNVALRSRASADHEPSIQQPVDMVELRPWTALIEDGRPHLLDQSIDLIEYAELARAGIRDAMVVPIRDDEGVTGMMLVANRMGEVSTFDPADMRLFETLANHAGIWLEKGRLEKALAHVSELKEELKRRALYDALTGLANRTLLCERIEHALSRRPTSHEGPALLFLDLDDFKTVNDSLGHSAGDELLRAVALRVRECVRPQDTIARLGGDEFAILIEEVTHMSQADDLAERIIQALKKPFNIEETEVFVRCSIGIARGIADRDQAAEVIRNADVAMYRAKQAGKARYQEFEPSMHRHAVKRLETLVQLRRAIENEELELVFQPIVSLTDRRLAGVEALVRWNHPELGMVGPDMFIPLAEETGLIVDLGRWVIHEACREASRWLEQYPTSAPPYVSVNISGRQLQEPSLVQDVVSALEQSGLEPRCLMLEVTESMLMHDPGSTNQKLHALRSLGCQLAVDDFGTGYSSLSHLGNFPLDAVKIPKPFIDALGNGTRDGSLARAIVTLGESLGLIVIAEGIEVWNQLSQLLELYCMMGQGYYLARPMKSSEIEGLMASGNGKIKSLAEPAVQGSLNGETPGAVLAAGVSAENGSGLRLP
jgi:diguanylate cyclase (GGDEF)-like protein